MCVGHGSRYVDVSVGVAAGVRDRCRAGGKWRDAFMGKDDGVGVGSERLATVELQVVEEEEEE